MRRAAGSYRACLCRPPADAGMAAERSVRVKTSEHPFHRIR
jgi:hypothetical protein